MTMNLETKLVFAIEHILHLEDLIKGNEWESYLMGDLSSFKFEIQRQLRLEQDRKAK